MYCRAGRCGSLCSFAALQGCDPSMCDTSSRYKGSIPGSYILFLLASLWLLITRVSSVYVCSSFFNPILHFSPGGGDIGL